MSNWNVIRLWHGREMLRREPEPCVTCDHQDHERLHCLTRDMPLEETEVDTFCEDYRYTCDPLGNADCSWCVHADVGTYGFTCKVEGREYSQMEGDKARDCSLWSDTRG